MTIEALGPFIRHISANKRLHGDRFSAASRLQTGA
jgi:hypothetical protein